ncbi:MAG: hypothetical protein WBJ21_13470, partial [Burkholderiaceae bacterium]
MKPFERSHVEVKGALSDALHSIICAEGCGLSGCCYLVKLKVRDICHGDRVAARAKRRLNRIDKWPPKYYICNGKL